MSKGAKIAGIIVGIFALIAIIGYGYEATTGLNMITGEKKTSGVGADKWIQQEGTSIPKSTSQLSATQPQSQKPSCDPSYPTVCIPPYPPDLDCSEISAKKFKVLQPDPHGFDRDNDGIGCES
ncbi:MAG: excalibur calcium-binding domain-containing protein [Nitrososphaeraceae archaeon]